MDNIKWGIIGCGDVTEIKSGPAFSKVPNSSLVAVMRRDAEKAEDYAKRHNVPFWYSDAKALIDNPEVNAIYIATPPSSHAEYAKMALEAGKPVYMEKPMGRTYQECLEVNQLAKRKNIPVNVAYYRRHLPTFLKVKEILESGVLGKIRFVEIKLFKHFDKTDEVPWRMDAEVAGGGHFYDLASHQIDLLHYFFGKIDSVQSVVDNLSGDYKVEDSLSVSMQFKNRIIFNGSWCFSAGEINNQDKFVIFGTKGNVEFSSFELAPLILKTNKGTKRFDFPQPQHVQQPLIEHIVESLRMGKASESTGETGAETNLILEKIVAEFYSKSSQ